MPNPDGSKPILKAWDRYLTGAGTLRHVYMDIAFDRVDHVPSNL